MRTQAARASSSTTRFTHDCRRPPEAISFPVRNGQNTQAQATRNEFLRRRRVDSVTSHVGYTRTTPLRRRVARVRASYVYDRTRHVYVNGRSTGRERCVPQESHDVNTVFRHPTRKTKIYTHTYIYIYRIQ